MDWQTGAAVYAAVVATGALFLEIRRWFESGVRVRAHSHHTYSMADLSQHAIIAEITNIGDAGTKLTSLEIWGYPSLLHAKLGISATCGAVFDPRTFSAHQGLPYALTAGDTWSGGISACELDRADPRFAVAYFAVNNTRYAKPFFCRIKI
ncbi:hypothetical protein FHX16_003970 [Rhizobium sp. BK661]|nr:hypothetical protein [Rhizobium sp. BK661]